MIKSKRHIPNSEVDDRLNIAREIAESFAAEGRVGDAAPGYFVQTFGCQQNEADSERLAGLARLMGYRKVNSPEEADLILVNTCAVREHAEKKALSIIGEYKHIKAKNKNLIIGVGGCMVTQAHRAEKLKNSNPYVSFTFDTGAIHEVPALVAKFVKQKKRSFVLSEDFKIAEGLPTERETSHSAWISVMNGCNNFCSYCIVPYVRGRERSRLPEDILKEVREVVAAGAKEITLLGQNVNSYGRGLEGCEDNIASLIRKICAIEGDFRVRFMTSHPKDASDELLDVVAFEPKVVKHLHLPVQSGSDRILERMNRKYTAEHYKGIIDRMKERNPDVTITSDIIVGFPGETEEDFGATLDLMEYVGYDMVFSFIYSPRVGTPAAEMDDMIPHEVSTERMSRLLALQDRIGLERSERYLGRRVKLFVEGVSRSDEGMLTGRGDMARPVHFKGDESLIGTFVEAEITEVAPYSLTAKII